MNKIKSLQHAINRKEYLKRILAKRPSEQFYMGDSEYAEDAVEQENYNNELLAENIKKEIKKCEKYIKLKNYE